MATKKMKVPELPPTTALHAAKVDDPDGEAWQRWAEARVADPETPILAYVAPALPAWSEKALGAVPGGDRRWASAEVRRLPIVR